MNYEAASEYMIGRLRNELPKEYFYHGLSHTLDVLKATENLAKGENITDSETIILLKTAAVYHDCGFLKKYTENEPVAVEMSHEILPGFGYSTEQINTIGRIIMATELKANNPSDILEKIIKDADFDYLGRDDYSPISMKLKREWECYGLKKTLIEWYEIQMMFLGNHTFYTATAKKYRDPMKAKHIEEIRQLLGK
jgi:uncharacterized protein